MTTIYFYEITDTKNRRVGIKAIRYNHAGYNTNHSFTDDEISKMENHIKTLYPSFVRYINPHIGPGHMTFNFTDKSDESSFELTAGIGVNTSGMEINL